MNLHFTDHLRYKDNYTGTLSFVRLFEDRVPVDIYG